MAAENITSKYPLIPAKGEIQGNYLRARVSKLGESFVLNRYVRITIVGISTKPHQGEEVMVGITNLDDQKDPRKEEVHSMIRDKWYMVGRTRVGIVANKSRPSRISLSFKLPSDTELLGEAQLDDQVELRYDKKWETSASSYSGYEEPEQKL